MDQAPLGLAAVANRASSPFAFGSRLLLLAAAGILAPSLGAMAGRYGEALAAGLMIIAGASALAAALKPWTGDRERARGYPERKHAGDSEDAIG